MPDDPNQPDPFEDIAAKFAAGPGPTEAGAQWRLMAAAMFQFTTALVEQGYTRREAIELTARIFGQVLSSQGRQQ
jgi:hypothetical protein